jgi:serine phosphatase RsbU (regulator of sigma subunit)
VALRDSAWTAVSLGLVAAVGILDGLMGGGLEGLLIAGPLVGSMQLSWRRTTLVSGAALATGLALAGAEDHLGMLHVQLRLAALIGLGAVCIAAARGRERRRERFDRLAIVAEAAQHAILRPIPPQVGQVAFAVRYLSASQDALIGGDLYDVLATAHGVRMVIGDVRGKGIDAVRLAALVLGFFRESAAIESDLATVAKDVDSAVATYLSDEDFVTAAFVDLSDTGRMSIVNCGHHPPLRLSPTSFEKLTAAEQSPPLGLGPRCVMESHRLRPGERLLLYTDGLVEARNHDSAFFDLDHLPDQLRSASTLDAALDALVDRLVAHVGGRLNDDLALVLAELVEAVPATPLGEGGGA